MLTRRFVCLALTALLLVPMIATPALAEWDEDNWLWNIIGPERLALGDEFGCHGYEGVDIREDPLVVEDCRDYLVGFTDSSRWGKNPVSFGHPNGAVMAETATSLQNAGFSIIGDMIEGDSHSLELVQRTTSLEKGQADLDALENAEADSLISIYWIARWYDVKIREDKGAISLLESQDIWFTTWGEWHGHRDSSESFNRILNSEPTTQSYQISNFDDSNWDVPGTALFEWSEAPNQILFDGESALLIPTSQRHLITGVRPIEGGALITAAPGVTIDLIFDTANVSVSKTPQTTFNGLHHSVTIVGHHVTNLHEWSSDFYNSPLRFTWLIERPAALEMNWHLPVIAIAVLIATPATIKWLVARDQESQNVGPVDTDTL